MDPAQANGIGQQFLAAYTGALEQQNAATLGSLYGADSIAIYDGNVVRGSQAILQGLFAPRLGQGPIKTRISGFSAQATPTNHMVITVDGEYSNPAGHFKQVFVLSSIPTGGMYIKADVCR